MRLWLPFTAGTCANVRDIKTLGGKQHVPQHRLRDLKVPC